jgi:hypothetical protein
MFEKVTDQIGGRLFDYLTDDDLKSVVRNVESGTDYNLGEYDPRETFIEVFDSVSKKFAIIPIIVFILIAANFIVYSSGPCIRFFPLQAYGLILDIAGAVIVVLGLIRGKWRLLLDSGYGYLIAGNTMGGEGSEQNFQNLYRRACKDTVNVVYGVGFFVIGFSIQIISVLRPYSPVYLGC